MKQLHIALPGPQTRALDCPADVLIYGGEKGGGKSVVLGIDAGRWCSRVPGFGAIILRRTRDELEGPGSLWEIAQRFYPKLGMTRSVTGPYLECTWGNGSSVRFRGCENEKDVFAHDGKSYAFVGIDEGQYWTEVMIWFLWACCRSTCGVKPYMRITCNPDPDCYLRVLLDWWIGEDGFPIPERDGVLRWLVRTDFGEEGLHWFDSKEEAEVWINDRKASGAMIGAEAEHTRPISITFIRARLSDNTALLAADPDYGARLALLDSVQRARKLGGNWNARATAGEMFSRSWFNVIDTRPSDDQIVQWVRGWDTAASEVTPQSPDPAWTRGVLMGLYRSGRVVVADVVGARMGPGGIDKLIGDTAKADGPRVTQAFWQDPGSAGKRDVEHITDVIRKAGANIVVEWEVEREDKITYASLFSAKIDPRAHQNANQADIVAGSYVSEYLSEHERFPNKTGKKDQVDASSRAWLELAKHSTGFAAAFVRGYRNIQA